MQMAAPSGSGSSGGGRDVLFRLRIAADPKDWADLKRFGDEAEKRQKSITESAIQQIKREAEAKRKAIEESGAWSLKVRRKSAEDEQKLNLSAIQQAKKSEQEKLDWIRNVRQKSMMQEHQDNLRAIQAKRQAESLAAKARETELTRLARIEQTARSQAITSRVAASQGFSQAGRGVIGLGRGIALASITDEKSAEKMLQTIIAIEAGFQTLNAGMDIWRGLAVGVENYRKALEAAKVAQAALSASQAAGGAASAAGDVSKVAGGSGLTGPAAIAALVGVALALRGVVEVFNNANRTDYGGATDRQTTTGGSVLGFFGKDSRRTVAKGLDFVASQGPLSLFGGGGYSAEADQLDSQDRLDSQIAFNQRRKAEANRTGDNYLSAGRMARANAYESNRQQFGFGPGSETQRDTRTNAADLAVAREMLAVAKQEADMAASSGNNKAAAARAEREAAEEVKRLLSEQYDLKKRAADEAVRGAQKELDLARQTASTAQQAYEAAADRLKSDEEKFGDATPQERAKLIEIARKKASGIALSIEEGNAARGFNAFRDFAGESSRARAKAAGSDSIFGQQVAETERLQKESAAAAADVLKQELTVNQKMEVTAKIDLEGREVLRDEFQKIADAMYDRTTEEFKNVTAGLDARQREFFQRYAQSRKP